MSTSNGNGYNRCCHRISLFFSLTHQGSTPVNYTVLYTVVVALFGSAYSITFLFPFLPEMVLYFGYAEENKGYYAGLIASGLFAGRVFGSFFWGWMSDRYGRRPIMLLTTLAVGFSNIAFGFSTTLAMAVTMRFINGLFNGLVGICKTVLYEISDDTNQAASMSAIAMAWGGGVVIGPLISGLLTQPATKYPSLFPEGSLFHSYPFLLPAIVASFMSVVGFFVVLWKLPETLGKHGKLVKHKAPDTEAVAKALLAPHKEPVAVEDQDTIFPKDISLRVSSRSATNLASTPSSVSGSPKGENKMRKISYSKSLCHLPAQYDDLCDVYGLGIPLSLSSQLPSDTPELSKGPSKTKSLPHISKYDKEAQDGDVEEEEEDEEVAIGAVSLVTDEAVKEVPDSSAVPAITLTVDPIEKRSAAFRGKLQKMTLCRLLQERDVVRSILLYAVLSFAVIGWEELFIVWASTQLRLGGLNLSAGKIGLAVGGSSTGLLFIQVFLYPKLVRRFGSLRVFQAAVIYLVFVSGLVPSLRYIYHQPVLMWVLLLLMTGVQKICVTSAFSSVSLFINNSVWPADAGSVNGIAMTMSALGRACAPILTGSVFAWSITIGVKIGYPFDVNLAFVFLAVLFLIINFISAFIPASLEKQKKRTHTSEKRASMS